MAAVSIATDNVPAHINYKMAAASRRLQAGSVLVYIAPLESELLSQLEIFTAGTTGPTLQAVKAKCRELVRSDSLLLAGPIDSKSLYVICKKKYFTSAAKQDLSSKFNIQLLGEEGGSVTLPLLKHCYEFTLKGRLAPKWNEISEWLVKGNDIFITGKTLALKVDIEVSVNELIVSITSHKLSVRHLEPIDLEVTSSVLRLFTEGINYIINEESISTNQCHVLPNLTEAHVYSVSHVTPPTNSQFNSYDAIRQHWKKQYGFILPATQSLFYQIFFSFNPTTFLSYPGCCVIRGRPLVIPSNSVHESGETFISDIHTRIPTICGITTRYTWKNPLGLVNQLMNPRAMRYPANTRPAVTMAIRKKPVSLGYPNIPKVLQNYRPHSTGASLLSTGASVPSTGASVPSTGASVPSTGTSVPSTGASIPSTGASVPSTGASLPSTGASVPSSCYGSSKRVLLEATPPTVAANGPSVSMSDGGLKRKRLTDEEEEGLSFKRYQTVPDVNKYIEEQEVQVHRVSSVEEIKLQKSKVPALKSWLQSHSVHYHSRDKKETLINLIKSHITSTGIHYN